MGKKKILLMRIFFSLRQIEDPEKTIEKEVVLGVLSQFVLLKEMKTLGKEITV